MKTEAIERVLFFFILIILSLPYNRVIVNAETVKELEKKFSREKKQLETIKRQIRRKNQEVLKRAKKEKSVITEIDSANNNLEVMNKELKIYEWNSEINVKKRKKLIYNLHEIQKNLDKKKKNLAHRLKILYKEGSGSYIKMLFSADNFVDFLQKMKYMNSVAKYDWQLIDRFKKKYQLLKKNEQRLKGIEEEIALYKKKAIEKKKEIRKQRNNKRHLLRKIRLKKESVKSFIAELKKTRERLTDLVKKLKERKKGHRNVSLSGFAKKMGYILWPVKGKIISGFGKVKSKKINAYLFNNGVEISSPLGANIKTVFDGEVIYENLMDGYGRIMIVDHGESYYSLYAHITEPSVAVGDKVAKGQVIAKVSESSFGKTSTSLYFEIRHKGKPQNPVKWLSSK